MVRSLRIDPMISGSNPVASSLYFQAYDVGSVLRIVTFLLVAQISLNVDYFNYIMRVIILKFGSQHAQCGA